MGEVAPALDPAVAAPLVTLTARSQFLAAARAKKAPMRGMIVQARHRDPSEPAPDSVGLGLTCSRKVGNAVTRNRAKRRLRAIAREVLPLRGLPGWDYVLIGRAGATVSRDYAGLRGDLEAALIKLHGHAR